MRVALLGDGRVYDAERVGRDGRVLLRTGRGGVIGRDMHRVGLQVQGGAFVHSIRVIFEPERRHGGWERHDDRRDWNRNDRRYDSNRNDRRYDSNRNDRRYDSNRNRNAG